MLSWAVPPAECSSTRVGRPDLLTSRPQVLAHVTIYVLQGLHNDSMDVRIQITGSGCRRPLRWRLTLARAQRTGDRPAAW